MGDDSARVRVLTYNVHGLHDDRQALYTAIQSVAPDVVLVQEAPRRLRWRSRCADLARRCGLYYAAGGGPAIGNLIMVSERVRVLRDWSLRFPLRAGRHLRGVAFAECVVRGSRFVAVGTHLSTDPVERVDQAVRLAPVLAGQSHPVLLGADLNEPPGGPVWDTLTGIGLTDPGADKDSPTISVTSPRARIDGLLLAPDFAVHEHAVLDTAATRTASDHFPVYAELSLPS
jgi:endonuclease/exonuclease/phosphatase family metal-dependent hydrolase